MDEPRPFRIIRRHDLPKYVGLERTQIAELIKASQFPRPILLSDHGRSVGWVADEVIAWQRFDAEIHHGAVDARVAVRLGGRTMIDLDSVDAFHAGLPRVNTGRP